MSIRYATMLDSAGNGAVVFETIGGKDDGKRIATAGVEPAELRQMAADFLEFADLLEETRR